MGYSTFDNQPLSSVQALTKGKTDSELLEAITLALLDNDEDIIRKMHDNAGNYNQRTIANLHVVSSIANAVRDRVAASPSVDGVGEVTAP